MIFFKNIYSYVHLPVSFISLKSWIILHCVNIPHFIYPFIHWWVSGLNIISGFYEETSNSMVKQMTLWWDEASLDIYIFKSDISRPWCRPVPNFLNTACTDFRSGCTHCHSQQQCLSVLISPHPYHHMLSFVLLIDRGSHLHTIWPLLRAEIIHASSFIYACLPFSLSWPLNLWFLWLLMQLRDIYSSPAYHKLVLPASCLFFQLVF